MNDYNISFLIQELIKGAAFTQIAAGELLLNMVAQHPNVNVDVNKKMISRLANRQDEVQSAIQSAAGSQAILGYAENYVKEKIIPVLSLIAQTQIESDILAQMKRDTSVPDKIISNCEMQYQNTDYVGFFRDAILFALGRGHNTLPEAKVKSDDFYYLTEADSRCPHCGNRLWKKVNGKVRNQYRIIHIYPEDLEKDQEAEFVKIKPRPIQLDVPENKIALCQDCAEEYLMDPTAEEYQSLLEKKQEISRHTKEREISSKSNLEDEIVDVIKAIAQPDAGKGMPPFAQVLSLDEKFKPEFSTLKRTVTGWVNDFYPFVEKQFSINDTNSANTLDLIRAEVNTIYLQYKKLGMNQQEICDSIANWMLNKNGLDTQYKTACYIVVAFFIQNCAIFEAAS